MPSSGLYWNCTCAYLPTDIHMCRLIIKHNINLLKYNEHRHPHESKLWGTVCTESLDMRIFSRLAKKEKERNMFTLFLSLSLPFSFSGCLYITYGCCHVPTANVKSHCRRARITFFSLWLPKLLKKYSKFCLVLWRVRKGQERCWVRWKSLK